MAHLGSHAFEIRLICFESQRFFLNVMFDEKTDKDAAVDLVTLDSVLHLVALDERHRPCSDTKLRRTLLCFHETCPGSISFPVIE